MVNIDPKYDVILTYSPIIEISGHVFECFDYYLFLRQYCKVGILFFCGLSRQSLEIAWNSKYNVPFHEAEKDIINVDITIPQNRIIKFGNNTSVIITDGNILSLEYNKIFLATKKLYGFMCEFDNFDKVKTNTHITYLQDYRVYGKNQYFKSIDYVKKLPFKHYKRCTRQFDNTGLIYMTYVCRKVLPSVVEKYHVISGCKQTYLVVPYKLPEYDSIPNVIQVEAPLDDFFNKFDTYIYTPVARKFDCSPRLVTECFLQKKKVIKQLDYYDIGLETRYNDCMTNLEGLNLTDNDRILDILRIR